MVIFRLAITAVALAASLTFASPIPLEAGRDALKRGDLNEALKAYGGISVKDPAWQDKVEDLTRFMLLKENGLEAWRMLQVGRRVNRYRDGWKDLERLAVYRANACPLSLPAADENRARLLNAAVYRFMGQMFTSASASEPGEDAITGHLATGLVPYLQDIPKMELVPNRGCRAARVLTRSANGLLKSELSELRSYLDDAPEDGSATRILVVMRALELAEQTQKSKVVKELLRELPSTGAIPWLELPELERQWLFVHVFGANRLDEVPADKREQAQEIARINLLQEGASPYWLAFIDVLSLPPKARIAVLSRAEKLGPFKGRAWALFQLAVANQEVERTLDALTVLRRLLVEGEETLDPALEDASVRFAARIYSVYRFNESLEGALQAALPSRLWNEFLLQSMMRASIAGRSVEFHRLETLRNRRMHQTAVRATPETLLSRALAERSLSHFDKALAEFKYSPDRLLNFARTYASFMVSEDAPQNAEVALTRFSGALVKRLRQLTPMGGEAEDAVKDLTIALETPKGEWGKGGQSVRRGLIKLGTAHWKAADLRPVDFALKPASTMPRRELFFVPLAAGERGWKFSTAVR